MTDLGFISCLDQDIIEKYLKRTYLDRYEAERDFIKLFKRKGIRDNDLDTDEGKKLLEMPPSEVAKLHKKLYKNRNRYISSIKDLVSITYFKDFPNEIILKLDLDIKTLITINTYSDILNASLIKKLSKLLQLQYIKEIDDFPEEYRECPYLEYTEKVIQKDFVREYVDIDYGYAVQQAIYKLDIDSLRVLQKEHSLSKKNIIDLIKRTGIYSEEIENFLIDILDDSKNKYFLFDYDRTFLTKVFNFIIFFGYNKLFKTLDITIEGNNLDKIMDYSVKGSNTEIYNKYSDQYFKRGIIGDHMLAFVYYSGNKQIIEDFTKKDIEKCNLLFAMLGGNTELLKDFDFDEVKINHYFLRLENFNLTKIQGLSFLLDNFKEDKIKVYINKIKYMTKEVFYFVLDNDIITKEEALIYICKRADYDINKFIKDYSVNITSEVAISLLNNSIFSNFKLVINKLNKKHYCDILHKSSKLNFYYIKILIQECDSVPEKLFNDDISSRSLKYIIELNDGIEGLDHILESKSNDKLEYLLTWNHSKKQLINMIKGNDNLSIENIKYFTDKYDIREIEHILETKNKDTLSYLLTLNPTQKQLSNMILRSKREEYFNLLDNETKLSILTKPDIYKKWGFDSVKKFIKTTDLPRAEKGTHAKTRLIIYNVIEYVYDGDQRRMFLEGLTDEGYTNLSFITRTKNKIKKENQDNSVPRKR